MDSPQAGSEDTVASPNGRPVAELLVSVVVPAYNEAEVLPEFHRRVT